MRFLIFGILVAIPLALVGGIVWHGHGDPHEEVAPVAAQAPKNGGDSALLDVVRAPLPGFTVKVPATLYDEKKLFEYIDGAAPIYLERHFRRLAAVELATADGGELTCDVYDMTGGDNARSIADKERAPSAKEVPGWPEARTGPLSFIFHRDRYYVKLTAFDAKAEAKLPDLAAVLRERIR